MSDVLDVLLASLAQDFDVEAVERTFDGERERLCVDIRVSPEQLQAARWKVIEARARLALISEPADPIANVETRSSAGPRDGSPQGPSCKLIGLDL